jgi:hypothetical protein
MKSDYLCITKILALALLLPITGFSYASEWEYLVETYYLTGNDKRLSATMTKLGKDRWELVNCSVADAELTCIFKRPGK